MGDSEQWKPSFSDLLAVGAAVIAVATWLTEPGWLLGVILSTLIIALVIFAAFRHNSHVVIRIGVSLVVVAGYSYFVGPRLWADFEKSRAKESVVIPSSPPAVLSSSDNRHGAQSPDVGGAKPSGPGAAIVIEGGKGEISNNSITVGRVSGFDRALDIEGDSSKINNNTFKLSEIDKSDIDGYFHVINRSIKREIDGTYTHTIVFNLIASRQPKLLRIQAWDRFVIGINIISLTQGTASSDGHDKSFFFSEVENPYGRFEMKVKTRNNINPTVYSTLK